MDQEIQEKLCKETPYVARVELQIIPAEVYFGVPKSVLEIKKKGVSFEEIQLWVQEPPEKHLPNSAKGYVGKCGYTRFFPHQPLSAKSATLAIYLSDR